ncbi:MAG TPA: nitroreductase [Chromatiales bacterium]|nr:nitroreductase [Chromatiales bacterium]
MWDLFETVRHRHSVRHFQADMPVGREKLNAVLEIACAAPSAGGLQAYRIVAIESAEARRQLAHAAHDQACLAEAPLTLAFVTQPARSEQTYGARGRELYAIQDATIAAAYAQLAAVAAGLACGWVGSFDEEAVCGVIGCGADERPVALIPIGYPAELPQETPRRPLGDMVRTL